jgi:hypothetical protein
MWIDTNDGTVVHFHSEFRGLRPNWPLPDVITEEIIAELGFAPVQQSTPSYDPLREVATELAPVKQDGSWVQKWVITGLDSATVAANCKVARESMWARIAAHRDTREESGFKLGSNWFHSDPKSQTKYLGLKDTARDILAAGGAGSDVIKEQGIDITWHTMDNSDIPVTVDLAFALVAAVKTLQATVFMNAKVHRGAMERATRPDLYDFSAGWPATYQGD